jgi:hypothetical protein
MDMFETPVVLLTLAMFLAIGVERMLELARAIGDHFEARHGVWAAGKWTAKADRLRARIEVRLNNARSGDSAAWQLVLSVVCRYLGPPSQSSGGLMAISVEQVRCMSIRLRYKIVGILIGIELAAAFQIDIFELVNQELAREPGQAITLPRGLGIVISGIAIGLGSGPVHKIITALEDARRKRV